MKYLNILENKNDKDNYIFYISDEQNFKSFAFEKLMQFEIIEESLLFFNQNYLNKILFYLNLKENPISLEESIKTFNEDKKIILNVILIFDFLRFINIRTNKNFIPNQFIDYLIPIFAKNKFLKLGKIRNNFNKSVLSIKNNEIYIKFLTKKINIVDFVRLDLNENDRETLLNNHDYRQVNFEKISDYFEDLEYKFNHNFNLISGNYKKLFKEKDEELESTIFIKKIERLFNLKKIVTQPIATIPFFNSVKVNNLKKIKAEKINTLLFFNEVTKKITIFDDPFINIKKNLIYLVKNFKNEEIKDIFLQNSEESSLINFNIDGENLICLSAFYDNLDLLKFLIEIDFDINLTDLSGNTSLHLSCKQGHKKITEFLIKSKININHQNVSGHSALHFCISENDYKLSLLLIENGADLNQVDKNGNSSLSLCSFYGDFKTAEILIEKNCDLYSKNNAGYDARSIAILSKNHKIAELIENAIIKDKHYKPKNFLVLPSGIIKT